MPVSPLDKKFIVVAHRGKFWLDHVVPFGLSSAAGLQGEVADAIMALLAAMGIRPSSKWVDDVVIFRFPLPVDDVDVQPLDKRTIFRSADQKHVYLYDRSKAKAIISSLGTPWHLLKGQEFDYGFIYSGFSWNIDRQDVQLTDEKRLRMLQRIDDFMAAHHRRPCPLKDVLKIHGSLSHITFVFPHGAAHLTSLSSFIATFPTSPSLSPRPRFAPPSMWTDLRWWKDLLLAGPGLRSLTPLGSTLDLGIWVDASTDWGVAIVWGGKEYSAWRWLEGWNHAPGCNIGWGEGIAVELAIVLLDQLGLSNRRILIRSDNMGVIGAFDKHRSRNWMVNQCIRRSDVISIARHLEFELVYVASEDNLADPFSRGERVAGFTRIETDIPLPGALTPYLAHA